MLSSSPKGRPTDTLVEFIHRLNHEIGIVLPSDWQRLPDIEISRRFLTGINQYFFQTYQGIGTTSFKDEELQYFSEFHKFWEKHHADILDARVDRQQAQRAAEALQAAVLRYGSEILGLTVNTHGLPPRAIAQVRFLTANQDFREPPKRQFERYLQDPTRFDATEIAQNPTEFLSFLGLTQLSQTDKRTDFARNAAKFLLERDINAYELAENHANDAVEIRSALVGTRNMGYGLKKANMFLRDMVEMDVWPNLNGIEAIDVANDINTMKVALRLRIVTTAIPLLSSFLDVFCHQYSEVDHVCALAWRSVWEAWHQLDDSTAPASPAGADFLLYRIGREHCKDNLVQYKCANGHSFYYFGARLTLCPECKKNGVRSGVQVVARRLPCQVEAEQLPHEDGVLSISDTKLLRKFEGVCIFKKVCSPDSDEFHQLEPPKSISIKGRTSWTSSYADTKRGGGGMMG